MNKVKIRDSKIMIRNGTKLTKLVVFPVMQLYIVEHKCIDKIKSVRENK